MGEFCDYLKTINMKCTSCFENGIGACHVHLGDQKYYAKFGLTDIIQIIRHDHKLTIESDIEITYKTEYAWGRHVGKGAQFAIEQAQKEKKVIDFLEPKLPSGVSLLPLHAHYEPDLHDPEVAALHIHVHKNVDDLDEAKAIIEQLAKIINPREIEEAMK